MKSKVALYTLACLASAGAQAQDAPPPVVPVIAQPPQIVPVNNQLVLPSNTEVTVSLNQEVSSKKMKEGAKFDVSVSRDVMLGNYVVIPRGTRGRGEITYRTGKGAFGKSAKMEIEVRSLDMNGRIVPLSGKFRQEGAGNTGATIGAVVAVGVFAAFVTGKSAVFEQGRELRTFTTEPLPVVIAAAPVAVAATQAGGSN